MIPSGLQAFVDDNRKLSATTNKLAAITSERDNLRKAYRQRMEQFELLKRRLSQAPAESKTPAKSPRI